MECQNRISVLEVKLKALESERCSMQRHQSENPTKTRGRQICCIEKAIRKNKRRINGWKQNLIKLQKKSLLRQQAKQQGKELLAMMNSLMEEK